MKIEQFMTSDPITAGTDTNMEEAMQLMRLHQIRHLPVVEDAKLVGIVTERDIRRASPSLLSGIDQEEYKSVLQSTPISRIMTREPLTVTRDTPLVEVVRLLFQKKFGSLPIVEDHAIIGIFTDYDALKVLLKVLSNVSRKKPG